MSEQCIGLVLAGGRSSRMGENKALLKREGQTMLEYTSAQLTACGLNTVIVSGKNSGGLSDIVSNGGPLAGVHAAIKTHRPAAILVVPVDMPLMSKTQLSLLLEAGRDSTTPIHFNDISLPIYLPVTPQLRQFLDQAFLSPQFITSGRGPSFKQLMRLMSAQSLPLSNDQCLINTNTPEQWQQSQRFIKS